MTCKNPFLEHGYYGDREYQEAQHGEECIICKAAAQVVTFDVPLCSEPQQVIGFCRSCCEHIFPRLLAWAKLSKVPEDCRRPVWSGTLS